MSNYAHLCCIPCREILFVKDSDSDAHASPRELGQFLEKHHRHHLEFLHENDGVGTLSCLIHRQTPQRSNADLRGSRRRQPHDFTLPDTRCW